MSINGYQYYNLTENELKKIQSLEKELNKNKDNNEELILLAFDREN